MPTASGSDEITQEDAQSQLEDALNAASTASEVETSSTGDSFVPNPSGKNQFPDCPPKTCPEFRRLLREYHKSSTNCLLVSELLAKEHHILASARTVARRWREMGLRASRATEATIHRNEVIQMVADQMSLDPSGRIGKTVTKHEIAVRTGLHLKRRTVGDIQKILDPEAAAARYPTARKVLRVPLTSNGPNEVWCCDGHDKLCKYGFAIWGIRDKFSRKWLGLWVVPNNRIGIVVAYLWLSLVRELGGMPKQTSTDCGTENTLIYGLAHTLREASAHHETDKRAHIFLRSIHHVPIERGWLDLRHELGHNFPHFWEEGRNVYQEGNRIHYYLALWLWPPLMQKELDRFRNSTNLRRVRKQKAKALPSGVSPHIAYTLPEKYNGVDCLQPVDTDLVDAILADMQPEKEALTDWGIPEEFDRRAQEIFDTLPVREVTMQTVWITFSAMLQHLERYFEP